MHQLITNILVRSGLSDIMSTNDAAVALNLRPQTLLKWAHMENAPIRPIRVNGRLAWRISDIFDLLEGNSTEVHHG